MRRFEWEEGRRTVGYSGSFDFQAKLMSPDIITLAVHFSASHKKIFF